MKIAKILSDRAERPEDLVAAGPVVNMVFQRGRRALSLRAGKVFHLLVKAAGADLAVSRSHKLNLLEFQELTHLSHDQILSVVRELQQTIVEVASYIPEEIAEEYDAEVAEDFRRHTSDVPPREDAPLVKRVISGPLLELVDRRENRKGTLVFRFSWIMRHVFENTDHWAIISRRAVMAFESRYALRLFELISLRVNLEHKTSELFNLDQLRDHLGVPDNKLARWQDVKRKVIEPAIAEVNHLAGFTVAYEPIKHGRSVTGVKISWKTKEANGVKAAKAELERHSVGRKARREGTVEQVTVVEVLPSSALGPFPEHGIRFSRWEPIARETLPHPTPDLDLVAAEFRKWIRGKGIPLDSSNIEKAFRGFCRGMKPAR